VKAMHRSDDLSWPEAMALAGNGRDQPVQRLHVTTPDTGLIPLTPSRWPTKRVEQVGRRRWQWQCTHPTTGVVLASGHAPTERWAWHRADAAAKRIHDQPPEAEQ
jgi:hypothetical protein